MPELDFSVKLEKSEEALGRYGSSNKNQVFSLPGQFPNAFSAYSSKRTSSLFWFVALSKTNSDIYLICACNEGFIELVTNSGFYVYFECPVCFQMQHCSFCALPEARMSPNNGDLYKNPQCNI